MKFLITQLLFNIIMGVYQYSKKKEKNNEKIGKK